MAAQADVEFILGQIEGYIKQSAQYASDHFVRNKISLCLFEGISTEMTPEFCGRLYKELVTDMIRSERSFGTNYSLYAAVIPEKKDGDGVLFTVQLGIVFPFLHPDDQEDDSPDVAP